MLKNAKTIVFLGTVLLLTACASQNPMLGGVKDELYYSGTSPLTIDNNDLVAAEISVINSEGYNSTVSSLSNDEQDRISNNLLVLFNFDSKEINDSMKTALAVQIEVLKSNPKLRAMLEGRTDERGTKTYNLVLSEYRADSVKRYLIEHGVSEEQILTIGLGENEPLFLNLKGEEFWKNNRSVFFKFIN